MSFTGQANCHIILELGKELGFDEELTNKISQYLENEYLIEYPEMGRRVSITHEGVKEVESALSNPEESTYYFPPVNIINVDKMENSLIQQGTNSSHQTGSFTIITTNLINEYLEKLKKELPKITLEPDDQSEIDADIQTIDTQIKSSRPKSLVVKSSLESIKRILEGAGGSIIAQQLLQNLPSLINMI